MLPRQDSSDLAPPDGQFRKEPARRKETQLPRARKTGTRERRGHGGRGGMKSGAEARLSGAPGQAGHRAISTASAPSPPQPFQYPAIASRGSTSPNRKPMLAMVASCSGGAWEATQSTASTP